MKKTFVLISLFISAVAAVAQPQLNKNNIDEVVKAMTLEEKVYLLVGGTGDITIPGMPENQGAPVAGVAGITRAIPRLGIPATILADGPAGARVNPADENAEITTFATGYPVGTALASTWNPALVSELTAAMGHEVKEYGIDLFLAPGQNIHRNALCGRNFEYFSEDPLVAGKMSAAYVNGIQSQGVGATVKHFIANNQETNREFVDVHASPRALREIYLKGFEIAIRESDPWALMTSYNSVNGKFTQQNYDLVTTVLRDEWGFDGMVMTDWGFKEGTPYIVKSGNDLLQPGNQTEMERILAAAKDGTIKMEEIDRNVTRILEYVVKTPRFNGKSYNHDLRLEEHAELVRNAADEGMVLLKNNGVLPLAPEQTVALYGVGSYDLIAGGGGSGNVNKKYVRSLYEGFVDNGIKFDQTLAEWYKKYAYFAFEDLKLRNPDYDRFWGHYILPELPMPERNINLTLANTDVAVLTIGRVSEEGRDRRYIKDDFLLSDIEQNLIRTICDKYHQDGKKVVVVLNVAGVIETASWKHLPDAILLAWLPGQEAGLSIADVLCGKAYPSGKLATTFPNNYFDNPSSFNFPYDHIKDQYKDMIREKNEKDFDYSEYTDGIWVGYRYFQTAGVEVSYPFGHGLSYTEFEYSKPVVKATADGFTATVTVTNTGKSAGKEVVQLYVTAPEGGLAKPAYELKEFVKTKELQPGESQTVTMTVSNYDLASFNTAASAWESPAGTYKVHFASSVEDIRLTSEYKIKKNNTWKTNDVLHPENEVKEISVVR